ncbi:MAG TPA: hypothetical protein VEC16_00035 [Alphaproteobacteria bacterium]|nr:hypothetical protein [Alphaproteobacteria bacterium]
MKREHTSKIGKWSFIAGLVIAILTGFLQYAWFPAVLFALGVAVGFFNVSKDEVLLYLAATAVLILSASSLLNLQNLIGGGATAVLASILANFNAFVAASGLVVAVRTVIALGQNE